jgi:pyruvate dehydrogenase kinase 2/3/4
MLDAIKRRHDPTVTTVAQGVLEWKRSQKAKNIGLDIQAWLDRFYMSRIGIRFLIGQRELFLAKASFMITSSTTFCQTSH